MVDTEQPIYIFSVRIQWKVLTSHFNRNFFEYFDSGQVWPHWGYLLGIFNWGLLDDELLNSINVYILENVSTDEQSEYNIVLILVRFSQMAIMLSGEKIKKKLLSAKLENIINFKYI